MKKISVGLILLIGIAFFYEIIISFTLILIFKFVNPQNVKSIELNEIHQRAKLIDVRSKAEFDVSHLPNAINLPIDSFEPSLIHQFDKKDSLVFYCSVGYRSGIIAEEFERNNFEHTYNLCGGIFKAINEKEALFNSKNQATDSIHTFDFYWSFLITNGEKIN